MAAVKLMNGYTMLLQEMMSARVALPGERKEACRKRVFARVQETWKGMDAEARLQYTQQAQLQNRLKANERKLVLHHGAASAPQQRAISAASCAKPRKRKAIDNLQPVDCDTVAKALEEGLAGRSSMVIRRPDSNPGRVDACAPFGGHGTMGLGDKAYALNVKLVASLQSETASLVPNLASSWRARSGGRVEEAAQFRQTTEQSCHEEYTAVQCAKEVKDALLHERICEQLLVFVSNYRRAFLKGSRNMGPDAMIQHPLLAVKFKTRTTTCCSACKFSCSA